MPVDWPSAKQISFASFVLHHKALDAGDLGLRPTLAVHSEALAAHLVSPCRESQPAVSSCGSIVSIYCMPQCVHGEATRQAAFALWLTQMKICAGIPASSAPASGAFGVPASGAFGAPAGGGFSAPAASSASAGFGGPGAFGSGFGAPTGSPAPAAGGFGAPAASGAGVGLFGTPQAASSGQC